MFDIGFYELVLVGVVALVVFGPTEVATIMYKLGKWAGKVKNIQQDFRASQKKVFDDLALEDYKTNAKNTAAKTQPLTDATRNEK